MYYITKYIIHCSLNYSWWRHNLSTKPAHTRKGLPYVPCFEMKW